jgi:hypothetical protein
MKSADVRLVLSGLLWCFRNQTPDFLQASSFMFFFFGCRSSSSSQARDIHCFLLSRVHKLMDVLCCPSDKESIRRRVIQLHLILFI